MQFTTLTIAALAGVAMSIALPGGKETVTVTVTEKGSDCTPPGYGSTTSTPVSPPGYGGHSSSPIVTLPTVKPTSSKWKPSKPAPTSSGPAPTGSLAPGGTTCSTGNVQSCCNPNEHGILQGLNCVVSGVLGCNSGAVACCPTDGVQTGLINIGSICVPIVL